LCVKILDNINRRVFYLKCNVSETRFYLRLEVVPTQLAPVDRASSCLCHYENRKYISMSIIDFSPVYIKKMLPKCIYDFVIPHCSTYGASKSSFKEVQNNDQISVIYPRMGKRMETFVNSRFVLVVQKLSTYTCNCCPEVNTHNYRCENLKSYES
jgi:hypothetical protein